MIPPHGREDLSGIDRKTLSDVVKYLDDLVEPIVPIFGEANVNAGETRAIIDIDCGALWGYIICVDLTSHAFVNIDGVIVIAHRVFSTQVAVVTLPKKIICQHVTISVLNESTAPTSVKVTAFVEPLKG